MDPVPRVLRVSEAGTSPARVVTCGGPSSFTGPSGAGGTITGPLGNNWRQTGSTESAEERTRAAHQPPTPQRREPPDRIARHRRHKQFPTVRHPRPPNQHVELLDRCLGKPLNHPLERPLSQVSHRLSVHLATRRKTIGPNEPAVSAGTRMISLALLALGCTLSVTPSGSKLPRVTWPRSGPREAFLVVPLR